jgi:hypothetical protein
MVKIIKKMARKASASLAKRTLQKNVNHPAGIAFKNSWESLLSSPVYRWLVRVGQTPARAGTGVHGRTFELLSAGIPDFYRSAEILICSNLKDAIESDESFVAVQIHDGHRFLSKVLAQHKRPFTRIVRNPTSYIQSLSKRGIDVSFARAIKDDLLSLTYLREAVKSNHVICSVIDYSDAKGKKVYINPAIFGFANRVKIPVFFVKAYVNDVGVGELITSGPHYNLDPLKCTKMFLDFSNSVGQHSRISMSIKRYNQHSDWQKRGKR